MNKLAFHVEPHLARYGTPASSTRSCRRASAGRSRSGRRASIIAVPGCDPLQREQLNGSDRSGTIPSFLVGGRCSSRADRRRWEYALALNTRAVSRETAPCNPAQPHVHIHTIEQRVWRSLMADPNGLSVQVVGPFSLAATCTEGRILQARIPAYGYARPDTRDEAILIVGRVSRETL